jgi:hypothetical protein
MAKLNREATLFRDVVLIPFLKNNEPLNAMADATIYEKTKSFFPNKTDKQIKKYFTDLRSMYVLHNVERKQKINNAIKIKTKKIKKTKNVNTGEVCIIEESETVKCKIVQIQFKSPEAEKMVKITGETLDTCKEKMANYKSQEFLKRKSELTKFYDVYLQKYVTQIKAGNKVEIDSDDYKNYKRIEEMMMNRIKNINYIEGMEIFGLSKIHETLFNAQKSMHGALLNEKIMVEEGVITTSTANTSDIQKDSEIIDEVSQKLLDVLDSSVIR